MRDKVQKFSCHFLFYGVAGHELLKNLPIIATLESPSTEQRSSIKSLTIRPLLIERISLPDLANHCKQTFTSPLEGVVDVVAQFVSQARGRRAWVMSSIDEIDKRCASSDLSTTEETADLEPSTVEIWTRVQLLSLADRSA